MRCILIRSGGNKNWFLVFFTQLKQKRLEILNQEFTKKKTCFLTFQQVTPEALMNHERELQFRVQFYLILKSIFESISIFMTTIIIISAGQFQTVNIAYSLLLYNIIRNPKIFHVTKLSYKRKHNSTEKAKPISRTRKAYWKQKKQQWTFYLPFYPAS